MAAKRKAYGLILMWSLEDPRERLLRLFHPQHWERQNQNLEIDEPTTARTTLSASFTVFLDQSLNLTGKPPTLLFIWPSPEIFIAYNFASRYIYHVSTYMTIQEPPDGVITSLVNFNTTLVRQVGLNKAELVSMYDDKQIDVRKKVLHTPWPN